MNHSNAPNPVTVLQGNGQYNKTVLRLRPFVLADKHKPLIAEHYRISDVVNAKAIDISTYGRVQDKPDGELIPSGDVRVSDCILERVGRDEHGQANGLHIDFLRIAGGGKLDLPEVNVIVEGVTIADGEALPLIIQDGRFGTVLLRRVSVRNTTRTVQISTKGGGWIRELRIEECHGLRVMLQPGSDIRRVVVIDSPGAVVG